MFTPLAVAVSARTSAPLPGGRRVPGPGQDEGEVPKENSTEGSWAVTENKVCFTICFWHRFTLWRKILR